MVERLTAAGAVVASVNVGAVRTVEWRGQRITTGIWKEPVGGPVLVRGPYLVRSARQVEGVIGAAEFRLSAEEIAEMQLSSKDGGKGRVGPNVRCGAAHWAAAGHWPAC